MNFFQSLLSSRKKRKKISPLAQSGWVLFFIFLVFGFVFFSQWDEFKVQNTQEQASSGGSITDVSLGRIFNLNPLTNPRFSLDKDISYLVFEGLLKYNPHNGKIEPAVAEFIKGSNENGATTFLFTLKESARFSNGERVTPEDVTFTYETIIKNPDFESYNQELANVFNYISVEKVDENSVLFTSLEENEHLMNLFTLPILPFEPFLSKEDASFDYVFDYENPYNQSPYGAGPYAIDKILEKGNQTTIYFKANEFYHDGEPYIKQVTMIAYPNETVFKENTHMDSEISARKGQVEPDIVSRISEESLPSPETISENFDTLNYELPEFTALYFNLDAPLARYKAFREGLTLGLNKDELVKIMPNSKRVDSFFEFLGISNAFHQTDIAKAKQILRDGGFPYSEAKEGRTNAPNGPLVEISLVTLNSDFYPLLGEKIQEVWQDELNIKVNLKTISFSELPGVLNNRSYDVLLFGQNFGETNTPFSAWHSLSSGQTNLSNLTNDEIDDLIFDYKTYGEESKLFELSQKLNDLIPAFPIGAPTYSVITSKRLNGFIIPSQKIEDTQLRDKMKTHSDRFYGIQKWYIKKEKQWVEQEGFPLVNYIKWRLESKNP